jgi:hypothetical protein
VVAEGLKQPKKTTSGSFLDAREVLVVAGQYMWSSLDSNRPHWAGFSHVGPPLVVVVIAAAVGCRCCCSSLLLRCDYALSLWCCWRFLSAVHSLRQHQV